MNSIEQVDLKIEEVNNLATLLLSRGSSSIRSTVGRRLRELEKERMDLEKKDQTESVKTID